MLKKILAVAAAAIMTLSLGVTAFAADSAGSQPAGQDQGNGGYIATKEFDATGVDAETVALCEAINAGTKTIADIPGVDVAGKTAITPVFDVYPVGNVVFPAAAVIKISALTSGCTNVTMLHYDVAAKAWEAIPAGNVDVAAKTASFTMKSCSPAIIVANVANAGSTTAAGTSPATGSASNTAAYAGIAVVLAAAAVVVVMRRKFA